MSTTTRSYRRGGVTSTGYAPMKRNAGMTTPIHNAPSGRTGKMLGRGMGVVGRSSRH